MASSSELPKRNPGGYRVTGVVWQITAGAQLVRRITQAVALPDPPSNSLTEVELAEFVRRLTEPAAQALAILRQHESQRTSGTYSQQQYERVEIRVLSGGRVVGRVNGARQVFNPQGRMTSPGDLSQWHRTGNLQLDNGNDKDSPEGRN